MFYILNNTSEISTYFKEVDRKGKRININDVPTSVIQAIYNECNADELSVCFIKNVYINKHFSNINGYETDYALVYNLSKIFQSIAACEYLKRCGVLFDYHVRGYDDPLDFVCSYVVYSLQGSISIEGLWGNFKLHVIPA